MSHKRGSLYLLAPTLVIATRRPSEAVGVVVGPQTTIAAPPYPSIADSAPLSHPRPVAGSDRERYLCHIAPLIVDGVDDLGWEGVGATLAEDPLSQERVRDGAMSFYARVPVTMAEPMPTEWLLQKQPLSED